MDSLVIVESPTKERTIGRFLSKNFLVKSSYGHVRDLPQREAIDVPVREQLIVELYSK